MFYILTAAAVSAGDLLIKYRIEKTREMHESKPILGGRVMTRRYHNKGAFLNFGEKNSVLVRVLSAGLTAAVFLLFVCTFALKGRGMLKAGLSLLLGGAFSNTYDRLYRKYVVDYFSFHTGLKVLDRVVFNLADFAIMVGALCAVVGARERRN